MKCAWTILNILLICSSGSMQVAVAADQVALTPEAALESGRVLQNMGRDEGQQVGSPASISPDGRQFVIRVARGEANNNRISVTFYKGYIQSSGRVSGVTEFAKVYSSGLSDSGSYFGPFQNTDGYANPVRWINNNTIAFISEDSFGVNQVTSLTLEGKLKALTHHSAQVSNFAVGPNGDIFFQAKARKIPNGAASASRSGFVVTDSMDGYAVTLNVYDGSNSLDKLWNTEWFYKPSPLAPETNVRIGPSGYDRYPTGFISISPTGRYALTSVSGIPAPTSWDWYQGPNRPNIQQAIRKPELSSARFVGMLYVVDLVNMKSWPLWDAPRNMSEAVAWAADGERVLIASAFLPSESLSRSGQTGNAMAVVNVSTGRYEELPLSMPTFGFASVNWLGPNTVEVSWQSLDGETNEVHTLEKEEVWRSISTTQVSLSNKVRFSIEESSNAPPIVLAESGERKQVILDPNPGFLNRYRLGRVEPIAGSFNGGRWDGRLFYPVGYQNGRRYPLVIQLDHGDSPSQSFSLNGEGNRGTGPSLVAPYAAQPLANEGFFVLQVAAHTQGGMPDPGTEGERTRIAVEQNISSLVQKGMVDSAKVGLTGFSRDGYYLLYILTQSDFPFAAAIAADNADGGYVTAALGNWDQYLDSLNGSSTFGDGLKHWLEVAPGFRAERIKTPIMFEAHTRDSLLQNWETFSRLRFLNRPAEMWAIPNLDHGHHNTQNPEQILAIQHRVIDWFKFWLNGHEDPDSLKARQYEGWRSLRERYRLSESTLRH